MPKLKTKSSARIRFNLTGAGKMLRAHAGNRHGPIRRTRKQIRDNRGRAVMDDADAQTVRKIHMPHGD